MVGVVNEERGQRSHSLSPGDDALRQQMKLLFKQRLCLLQVAVPTPVFESCRVREAFAELSGIFPCPMMGKES